jgi:uncharacterized protein (DUF2267 family)
MPSTGLPTFDKTLQESNLWLKELAAILKTREREMAYRVLRATLHALRDRLGAHNAVHLGAQLPMLLRGLYYEGFRLEESTTSERHLKPFIDHVRMELPPGLDADAESGARAVFWLLCDRLDKGEVAKIERILPREIRELMPPADVVN